MSIHNFLNAGKVLFLIFWSQKNQLIILFIYTIIALLLGACQSEQQQTPDVTERPVPATNTNIEALPPSSNHTHTFQYKMRSSNIEEGQKAPLLLILHGYKSNMNELFALTDYLDSRLIILSIQAPVNAGKDKYKWFDLIFSNNGDVIGNQAKAAESLQLLSRFIDASVEEFNADPEQVYLLGFSQGAMMSLYLALTEPTKIAGAAILSGKVLKGIENHVSSDSKALSDLNILVTHGKNDQVINIDHAKNMEGMLRDLSVSLSYKEYQMGHQISEQCLKDIVGWFENEINTNLSSSVSQ